MGRVWAIAVALIGLLLCSVVYACIWQGSLSWPGLREWLTARALLKSIPLLLGFYALASVGCWLSRFWFVRVSAVATIFAGILIAAVALNDVSTFSGRPMPGVAVSGFLFAPLIGCRPPSTRLNQLTPVSLNAGGPCRAQIAHLCSTLRFFGSSHCGIWVAGVSAL
jgi:hypothetical protein